jgi:hypothetical protein
LEKLDVQITSTDLGIVNFLRQLPENADSSIRCKCEITANVTISRNRQSQKLDAHITVIDGGIVMFFNPLFENVEMLIRSNFDPDS